MAESLLKRLTSQIGGNGGEAKALLVARGQMTKAGVLTRLGAKRQAMGRDGRAIDRAVKASGGAHKAGDYTYDPKTNTARLK